MIEAIWVGPFQNLVAFNYSLHAIKQEFDLGQRITLLIAETIHRVSYFSRLLLGYF